MKKTVLLGRILCQLPWHAYLLPLSMNLLSALSAILLLGASAWIIASAALHPPLYTLALGITLVRACGIGRAVFRYLDRWLSHRTVFQQLARLRSYVYSQAAQRLPERRAGKDTGEFLYDLTASMDHLRDFYLKILLPPISSLLLTLLALLLLWPISPTAALLCLAAWGAVLLLSLLSAFFSRRQSQAADQRYRSTLLDSLQGLAELQGNASWNTSRQKLDRAAQTLSRTRQQEQLPEALADTGALCCCGVAWVIIFWLLSPLIAQGRLSGIELAVYLLTLQSIFAEYQPLPAALRGLPAALNAAGRLLIPPAAAERVSRPVTGQPEGLLSGRHILFSYENALPLFLDLQFTLFPGEKIAIVGESGSGKTTLFHLLTRLWDPDRGNFFLQDKNYEDLPPEKIRAAFSSASQAGYIFSDSLRENFQRLYPAISEECIWTSLQLAQLSGTVQSLPQGLDTPLGEDGCLLSGGQRQRLLLALAFAGQAPMLLLDEPTAGLDRNCAQKIFQGIRQNFPDRTILVITHDLEASVRLDRILELADGRLQEVSLPSSPK